MASSTGKWALGTAVIAGIALVVGTAVIGAEGVAANGPVPPEPPTNVNVPSTPGPSESVHFTPPENDGGDPITGYTATCTSDNDGVEKSATGDASPITVTDLTYGKTYTCHVTAKNEDGTSVESQPSNSFVPVNVPAAPRPVSSLPYGPKTVKIIWSAPASDGGSPITGYVVRPYLASTAQPVRTFPSPATTQTVNGLNTGRTYSFEIAAVNAVGTGPYSAKTLPVVVGSPGQPQSVKVRKTASGSLQVTYAAPANNGATITSYTAGCNSSNGGTNNTRTQKAPPGAITVTGLTGGKSYTCAVKATNNRGTGPLSTRTPSVTA